MNKTDEINANNFTVARIGGVCFQHKYHSTNDPQILRCLDCGMETLVRGEEDD